MAETPVQALAEFVFKATVDYRKSAEVETRHIGTVQITDVYDMPPAEDAAESAVDVGFIVVGFTEYAADREGFCELLRAAVAARGEFHTFAPGEFLGGPSYITTGGWLGSQDLALRLYALLEHYGLAQVVTPDRIGIVDTELIRSMLGGGMVLFAAKPELKELLTR